MLITVTVHVMGLVMVASDVTTLIRTSQVFEEAKTTCEMADQCPYKRLEGLGLLSIQ